MARDRQMLLGLLASLLLSGSAVAQDASLHWQHDIETAKVMARNTGRMVLVHVWTENCGPCLALERKVFNQPGVAGAIEAKFVPVKLNANEFPATAQGFGVTRVPTDVVLSPEGQVIGKMISPATPMSYVSDLTQLANQYASRSGGGYNTAVAAALNRGQLNSAYAKLPIGAPPLPPAAMPPQPTAPQNQVSTGIPPAANPYAATAQPYDRYSTAGTPAAGTTSPAMMSNPYGNVGGSIAAPPMNTAQPSPSQGAPSSPQFPAVNPARMTPTHGAIDQYAPQAAMTAPMGMTNRYAMVQPSANTGGTNWPPQSAATAPTTSVAPVTPINVPLAAPSSAPAPGATDSVAAQQTAAPDSSDLPPGSPPLGFEGYCPVSMRNVWQWVPGDPKWGVAHRGRTYLFAGPREQQQFLANPDYYSPALAGLDPVMQIDHGQSVAGSREHSLDYGNQFYFFSSEATLAQFTANRERYVNGVRQAMDGAPVSGQVR